MGDTELRIQFPDSECLRFCSNGDIYVQGRLAANDRDVVEGMRYLLRTGGIDDLRAKLDKANERIAELELALEGHSDDCAGRPCTCEVAYIQAMSEGGG